jgi:hypothetical protein
MLNHGCQDRAPELHDSKQLPWSQIYNISKKELVTLRDDLETRLNRGCIKPFYSFTWAFVYFVPK